MKLNQIRIGFQGKIIVTKVLVVVALMGRLEVHFSMQYIQQFRTELFFHFYKALF